MKICARRFVKSILRRGFVKSELAVSQKEKLKLIPQSADKYYVGGGT